VNLTGCPLSERSAASAVAPQDRGDVLRRQDFLAGADPAGEQVRQRGPVELLVRVVSHRQRDLRLGRFRASLDREQHTDQFGVHGDEPFGVGLGRHDVQQRHELAGGRWRVMAQR